MIREIFAWLRGLILGSVIGIIFGVLFAAGTASVNPRAFMDLSRSIKRKIEGEEPEEQKYKVETETVKMGFQQEEES